MDPDQITKEWRRDVWKDHLTLVVTKIEITPEMDLKSHVSSVDCECIPELTKQDGVPVLIHNSFDGREIVEGYERGN